jgi:hypothetical protein
MPPLQNCIAVIKTGVNMPNFERIYQELAKIAQTENAKIGDLCRIA